MMLTLNFSKAELECRCCSRIPTEDGALSLPQWEWFLEELQRLREAYGKPMHISSGYRCEAHNRAIGSSDTSQHRKMAVDIVVAGENAYELLELAIDFGWNGIGVQQTGEWGRRFIHLDRRDDRMIWSY